jgi:hypothetical protein
VTDDKKLAELQRALGMSESEARMALAQARGDVDGCVVIVDTE